MSEPETSESIMTEADDRPVVLETQALTKTFSEAGRELKVLRGIDFIVRAEERIAIVGASGSGKTTLLQLLGGLDRCRSSVGRRRHIPIFY